MNLSHLAPVVRFDLNTQTKTNQQRLFPGLAKVVVLLLACGLTLIALAAARAEEGDITAVFSRASDDYGRNKLTDGSFEPETYTFGQGGLSGALNGDSIDKLKFVDIARTIARPLADKNYIPATDPKQTKLLIMVYWGTTNVDGDANRAGTYNGLSEASHSLSQANASAAGFGPSGRQLETKQAAAREMSQSSQRSAQSEFDSAMIMVEMENRIRDQADWRTAGILGYRGALVQTAGLEGSPLSYRRKELDTELEENRYYVVVMAYDFQLMWKQKKKKLLWETRFSICKHGNEFEKVLPEMTRYASRYFGQDSDGLIRKPLTGHVDFGELKVIGEVPDKNESQATKPEEQKN